MAEVSIDNGLELTDSMVVHTTAKYNESDMISKGQFMKPHFERETSLNLSNCSDQSSSNESVLLRKKKRIKIVKAIILWTIIGVVLSLLILPIVFYSLPVPEVSMYVK